VTINADGLANDVVIVNNARVFRFPKHAWSREALAKEAKVLELAAQYVEMPLPVFDYVREDVVSYPFVPGQTLYRDDILRLDEAGQNRLAAQVARFLQQLHTIPPDILEKHNIPPSDAVRTVADYLQMFETVQQKVYPLLMSDGREWVRRLFSPVLDNSDFLNYSGALINGDLATYHILYNPAQEQINGIIDFGTAGIGDPANDIALLINGLGESFVRRMIGFYPEIQAMLDRARFMAGALELEWILGGLRSQDNSWFVVHLGRARDVLPIGSRA
jgi:aminoglycoside 2''-phosphotransferase